MLDPTWNTYTSNPDYSACFGMVRQIEITGILRLLDCGKGVTYEARRTWKI